MNGVSIAADNYNNPTALVKSINRQMDIRRAMVKTDTRGDGLSMQLAFLKDYRTPVVGDLPAAQIPNYGPYVRDPKLISNLSNGKLSQKSTIFMGDDQELDLDNTFNKGPLKSGPSKGLTYSDPATEIEYSYRPDLRAYLPSKHDIEEKYVDVKLSATSDFQQLLPEFHTPVRISI